MLWGHSPMIRFEFPCTQMKNYMIETSHWPICCSSLSNYTSLKKKKKKTLCTGALAPESATEEQEHKYTCCYLLMCRERNYCLSVITFGSLKTVQLN